MTRAGDRPTLTAMSERGLHFVADDLDETWIEDWAGAGIGEIEDLLEKHSAGLRVLEADETV